jgi:hypothetical protein
VTTLTKRQLRLIDEAELRHGRWELAHVDGYDGQTITALIRRGLAEAQAAGPPHGNARYVLSAEGEQYRARRARNSSVDR